MSSTAKLITILVVIVLIGAGMWYYLSGNGSMSPSTGSQANSADSTALPSGSDTSDAALNQDMTQINANIQSADSDSDQATQSVNASAQ